MITAEQREAIRQLTEQQSGSPGYGEHKFFRLPFGFAVQISRQTPSEAWRKAHQAPWQRWFKGKNPE